MHRLGLTSAEALAQLSRLQPDRVGLQNLARPGDFLERQVPRWRWQLDSYEQVSNYVPLPAEPIRALERWLESRRPPAGAAAVVHGDAHLGNVMFRADDGQAVALVDWELATVGDPLLDLAEFLVCWPGPAGGGPYTKILPLWPTAGLASHEQLVEVYADVSGRDVSRLDWYKVLAAYRLAILLEGSQARARAGRGDEATGTLLHGVAVELLAWAAEQTGTEAP
jgi:aminoglycoside phosphotransferase (APT) family kinase protein